MKRKYIAEAWNKLFCKGKSDAKSTMYSLVKVKLLKIPIFHRSTSYYPIYRSVWTFMLHENFQLVSYRKRNEIQSTFKSIDRFMERYYSSKGSILCAFNILILKEKHENFWGIYTFRNVVSLHHVFLCNFAMCYCKHVLLRRWPRCRKKLQS